MKFCFLWLSLYVTAKGNQNIRAREVLSKQNYQLYKKYAIQLRP